MCCSVCRHFSSLEHTSLARWRYHWCLWKWITKFGSASPFACRLDSSRQRRDDGVFSLISFNTRSMTVSCCIGAQPQSVYKYFGEHLVNKFHVLLWIDHCLRVEPMAQHMGPWRRPKRARFLPTRACFHFVCLIIDNSLLCLYSLLIMYNYDCICIKTVFGSVLSTQCIKMFCVPVNTKTILLGTVFPTKYVYYYSYYYYTKVSRFRANCSIMYLPDQCSLGICCTSV